MCLLAHKWLTSQQARIRPPNTVIQSQPSNSKQGSAHQPLSFRAGPIRMGRAKNLPVGGNVAGIRRLRLECTAACGGRSSLPLAGASEPPAGVRMTHAGQAG